MRHLSISLIILIGFTSLSFHEPDPPIEEKDQQFLTNQVKKLVEDLQKEMDNVLVRYEEKLDEQLKKVEGKMDGQMERLDGRFEEIQQKLDAQVSKAEGRLDETFDKVDSEMGDVKSTLLGTVGTIAWRFTIVDIVTATLATFLTAFLTAYLTAKKIHVYKFRKELEAMLQETKQTIDTLK